MTTRTVSSSSSSFGATEAAALCAELATALRLPREQINWVKGGGESGVVMLSLSAGYGAPPAKTTATAADGDEEKEASPFHLDGGGRGATSTLFLPDEAEEKA